MNLRKNKRWIKQWFKKNSGNRKKFLEQLLDNIEMFPELRRQMRRTYNLYR